MKKQLYLRVIVGLVIVAGLIFIFNLSDTEPEEQPITSTQRTKFMMDTAIEIRATGFNSDTAVEQAFAEIERVERLFSRHLPDSEISAINNKAGSWVTVSPETVELIQKSLAFGEISSGSFDITVGTLIELWDIGGETNSVPTEAEIKSALANINYLDVEIEEQQNLIKIPPGSIIDLGGIAKGYAIDRAREVLRSAGIEHGMVFAGGDISTIGVKEDGTSWRVGIQDPRQSTSLLGIISLADSTIVTSGDYERFFIQDGVRYHHILDPDTGYPARDVISVTVVADSAADGDALSTAVFVLGRKAGLELIESITGFEAVIVDNDGEVWLSTGIENKIELL